MFYTLIILFVVGIFFGLAATYCFTDSIVDDHFNNDQQYFDIDSIVDQQYFDIKVEAREQPHFPIALIAHKPWPAAWLNNPWGHENDMLVTLDLFGPVENYLFSSRSIIR